MYVCGPTVYNLIHIGNARPMIVFDTARRYMEHKGYTVNYVSIGLLQVHDIFPHRIGQIDLIQLLLRKRLVVALHHLTGHPHYRGAWRHFLARWISQKGVRKTGIEIHPGAKIGKGFSTLLEERQRHSSTHTL